MMLMRGVLAVLLLSLCGCFVITWGTVYQSLAPDAGGLLRVQEKACLADCALRLIVNDEAGEHQIFRKSDCVVEFAHANWTGSVVAAFVDGLYCKQIKVAYDVRAHRIVDFESAAPALRASIIENYKVTAQELQENGGDVFKWATYPGDGNPHRAKNEFKARYGR